MMKRKRMTTMIARSFAHAAVLSLAVAAAQGQEAGTSRVPTTCGCATGEIVDADGHLNHAHCDAARVLSILHGYADAGARLLPERVGLPDIQIAQRKLEELRRQVVQDLLAVMTSEELDRFLPMLTNLDRPRLGDSVQHGHWRGASLFSCDNAVYWINKGLDELSGVSVPLLQLILEGQMFLNDPGLFCDPNLPANSPAYQNGLGLFGEAGGWLQFAADSMSQEAPGTAALGSLLAWWRSFQSGLAFIVAFNSPPLMGDGRCTEVGDAGLAMAGVAQAAYQGYLRAEECAQAGGYF